MLEEQGIVLKTARESFIVVTRDGRFLTVRKTLEAQIGEEIRFFQRDILEPGQLASRTPWHRTGTVWKVLSYAAAACLLISVGLTSIPGFQKTTHLVNETHLKKEVLEMPAAFVTVDINPSIELALNKADRVISGKGLNDDGRRVLDRARVKGQTLKSALSQISDSAFKLGYIKTNGDNQMLVTATSVSDATKKRLAEDLDLARKEAIEAVRQSAPEVQLKVAAITVPRDVREKANKVHLSVGKYIVLDTAKSNGIKLTADQIRQASLRKVIKTTGLDLNMIVREYGYHGEGSDDAFVAEISDHQKQPEQVQTASAGTRGNNRSGAPGAGKVNMARIESQQQLRKQSIKVSYGDQKAWKMKSQAQEKESAYEDRNPVPMPAPDDRPQKPIIVGVNIGQGGIEITSTLGALTKSLSASETVGSVPSQTQGQSANDSGTTAPQVSPPSQPVQSGQASQSAAVAGQPTNQQGAETKPAATTATVQTQTQGQAVPSGTVTFAKPQTSGWGNRWVHQSQPQPITESGK